MNNDIARLFELAERDMRPEFRDALMDHLEAEAHTAPDHPRLEWLTDETAPLIDLEAPHTERRRRRRWHPGAWLAIAAASLAVAVVLGHDGGGTRSVLMTSAPTSGDCRPGETLGVVPTATIALRVTLLPDGSDFCLVDDATGAALETVDRVALDPATQQSADAPFFVSQALVRDAALVYTINVPEGMPVASVASIDGALPSFFSSVGRRLLVVDTRVGSDRREPAGYDLNLMLSVGTVVATLTPSANLLDLLATEVTTTAEGSGAS